MSNQAHAKVQAQQKTASGSSSRSGLLQRACACGQHTIAGGECESCRNEHSLLLRFPGASTPPATPDAVPGNSSVQEQSASFLSVIDRAPRFGHDFSQLPIYTPLPGGIQTKLTINRLGDSYEQEADRLSLQVMRMPDSRLQRVCDCEGACSTCRTEQPDHEHEHERVQTKRVQAGEMGQSAAPTIVHEVLRSPGQPLDGATRAFMEPRFGYDFSQVRVHTDSQAAESARGVRALAYTVGKHIVFAEGQHSPGSVAGQRLFAHELTHVVQQGGADRVNAVPDSEARGPSTVPGISSAMSGASSAPVFVVQRKPEESTEATEEADSRTTEEAGSERRWQQIVGEHSTNVGKLGRVKAPRGVRLRVRPLPGAPNEVILPFDELVRVERRTDHGWLWVVAMGKQIGKTGFCEEQFVSLDPPEPTAHLYQVRPGNTLGAIAAHYYGKSMDDENNTRLYVQALYLANKGHAGVYLDEVNLSLTETLLRTGKEEEALKIYKGAKVRKGLAIWVPSDEFVQQLKAQGFISSGSTEVMKAWRRAKKFVGGLIEGAKYVAGFIIGLLKGAWDAIVDLFKGAVDMIEMVARVFYDLITGNPGRIKDMLMGWVEKLKLAWKNRAQIARDFMEKWEAEDGWDRGLFQGEVLGWVMMTALITIVTLGEGALVQLSGKWKFVIDALKLTQKAGDLGTYVGAATRSLGKAGTVISDALRASGLGKVVKVAETAARPVKWTVDFVKKALKLPPRIAGELTEAAAKRLQVLGEGALERIGKMKDWVKSWLFGCNSPCKWDPDRVLEELKHTDAEIEKRAAAATQQRGRDILDEFAERSRSRTGGRAEEFEGRRGSTTRTGQSEKARHKDPFAGEAGHHGFPQYLGGKYEQELINLPNDLHYLYHEEVDKVLKIPRKLGSAYYRKLSKAKMSELLDKLLEHAKKFDKRYGTKIEAALRKGIAEANPLAGRK